MKYCRQDLQCHRRENHSSKPLGDTVLCCALRTSFVSLCALSLCIASCATFSHTLSQLNLKYQAEVLRTTYPIPHTASLVPRTSCPVPCTSYPAPHTSYLVPRTWYTIPGQPRALFKHYLKYENEEQKQYRCIKLPGTPPCGGAPIQPVYV